MTVKKGSLSWNNVNVPLSQWILDGVEAQGFTEMTPVQAAAISLFTGNKDVIIDAVTGSGKTLAFVIPILQRLCNSDIARGNIFSIVVAPTRELAIQIKSVFETFLKYFPEDEDYIKQNNLPSFVTTQLLVGSLTSLQEDLQTFQDEKPQILIGTPGKILQFLSNPQIIKRTKEFNCMVLDEADRLLDISFETTIREIVRKLPRQKRMGLFSATIASAGDMVFKLGMSNPVKISVRNSSLMNAAPRSLTINHLVLKTEDKIKALFSILKTANFKKAIVYFPTCISVTYFYSMFSYLLTNSKDKDLKFFSIHGKLQLKARVKTLEYFSNNDKTSKSILMATDVAARGLDIPDVDLVIQMDPPTDPDVFLHRCGRTGRANRIGKAIVFLSDNKREEDYIEFMRVKKVDMEQYNNDDIDFNKLDFNMNLLFGFKKPIEMLLEKWILEDRARYDLCVRSYVGFIRYYSKHSALSIFRLQSLDYIGLAKEFGLFRLPKMPELKYVENMPDNGWLTKEINMDEYKYINPQKEQARLEELKNSEAKEKAKLRKLEKKQKNDAWSNRTQAKENKNIRQEKNKRKHIAIGALKEDISSEEDVDEDWKDIIRNKKKIKKNKNNKSGVIGTFDDL